MTIYVCVYVYIYVYVYIHMFFGGVKGYIILYVLGFIAGLKLQYFLAESIYPPPDCMCFFSLAVFSCPVKNGACDRLAACPDCLPTFTLDRAAMCSGASSTMDWESGKMG